MGRLDARAVTGEELRRFEKRLFTDLRKLSEMIGEGRIEEGVYRVGVEQEMFLIGEGNRPAPMAMEVLKELDDPSFTTEIARFNLEANLEPMMMSGDLLSRTEKRLEEVMSAAAEAARRVGVDVCLTGTFMTSQAFYPNLCQAEGAVIMNIASLAAQRSCALHANYCAAKAGVESLTQVLALEWAADQIRVIAVSPGVVNTPIVRKNMAPGSDREKAIIGMTPLGRLFGPDELARLILAYCSDDFSHVTGSTLVADGGFATAGGLPQFYN